MKQAVKINSSTNNIEVTDISESTEPILGICVRVEDEYAFVMTKGLCEFAGHALDISNRNIYYYNDSLTSLNINNDTSPTSTYIVGTLVSKSNGKNYIYVNPQYLVI